MERKHCFAPIVDGGTRILVLGSLPGERSLAQGQYYAHSQNKFWLLMGEVLGVELAGLAYPARLALLQQHRVGLWDVVASAHRTGSLDGNIRDHAGNDVLGLAQSLPSLRAIAFNGGTAARHGLKQLGAFSKRCEILQLPSSSPAYTLRYEAKRQAWLAMKDYL